MTPGLIVMLVCGVIGVSLVAWQRWKSITHRPRISLRRMYINARLEGLIDFDNFSATLQLIGQAYGFPPEKLRLSDSFGGELAAADAALPGDARETLWLSLKKQYPALSEHNQLDTVFDLISEIGKQ